ncbi:MAG: hypothetical protein D6729_14320 [Deltaproteobacteria bacterium]|nr:MAG: hypothetical protein D6729_14320 [Deltaproteobacteria bacterium]
MSALDKKIDALIQDFASELNALVREAALEAVREALGESSGGPAKSGRAMRRGRSRSTASKKAAKATRRASKRPGKRSPRQINSMMARILKVIETSPGQSIAEIAKALGAQTRDLTLPMRKLKAEGLIRTQGQKRATRYYPSKRRKSS